MAETVKEHDFIELDYTGKLEDGTVFDTTLESVAKENHLHDEKMKYEPLVICVGEKQLLPGLDDALQGAEIGKEHEIILTPESAFGKREVKNIRVVPLGTFKEHNVQPQPGLQIDIDGQRGVVTRVSGGRVIVNFNHPLAGRKVVYTVKINKKITDQKDQVLYFLSNTFRLPEEKIKVEVKEGKAVVELPMQLPEQITIAIGERLQEVTSLKEVKFAKKE